MSSLYVPVTSNNQVLLYPKGESAPRYIATPGLLFKLLAGAIFAGSRQYNIFNKLLNIITVEIIGQLSNFYILPKKFVPTKIYCNDSGIMDIAWILESKDKPGRIVFMYDPKDNIKERQAHTPTTLYFHNLSQLHLFLYGQMHSGHSPYSHWKVVGTNNAICGFLDKGFVSPTVAKNKGLKVWAFTQSKVPPVFYNPNTIKAKKKGDRQFISIYTIESNVGKVVAAGTTWNGDETLDMGAYENWVSPSGRVLKNYLARIV
jgi:hypothetical protein